jgi:phospholysine phosphohistidine inorganic pyrophosphate phosphatase
MEFGKLKSILSDIDGTLYFKGKLIEGAIETVSELKRRGFKLLFFTNTDSKTPKTIYSILKNYGFQVEEREIFSPIIALKEFLKSKPKSSLFLVTTKEVRGEFEEFDLVNKDKVPDFVIIADFQDDWNLNRLNQAFRYVLQGAKLLGTQGNRFFLDREGNPVIDTGSFVQLIAYAANVKPIIFGKPSKTFFNEALKLLGTKSEETLVIGDDIESDIQGAINSGIKAILVKTGKGTIYGNKKVPIKPNKIIDSFSSLLDCLKK